jgi:hypothetical protein
LFLVVLLFAGIQLFVDFLKDGVVVLAPDHVKVYSVFEIEVFDSFHTDVVLHNGWGVADHDVAAVVVTLNYQRVKIIDAHFGVDIYFFHNCLDFICC